MINSKDATPQLDKSYLERVEKLDIYGCYNHSPYSSIKVSSYFHVYEELLEEFRNKAITFRGWGAKWRRYDIKHL